VSADVVGRAGLALFQDQSQGAGVVVDIQPVAHVVALAVDRQRLAFQRVEDHQRDELLGKVIRAVVVGAVGGDDGHAVGVVPGAHQMVRARLAGRIGRIGCVGRFFGEKARVAERTVHLVGGDVVEAEAIPALGRQAAPVAARRVKQSVGAKDIRLDERRWAVDGAVDVRLGRQVHHAIGLMLCKNARDFPRIADIDLLEHMAGVPHQAWQRIEVAGIGELVDVDDRHIGFGNELANDRGPDETRPSRNQHFLH
jgi:hypothetical protein